MLRVCAFHNQFSISGPFDLSEWVPDGQVLPRHKIWLSALEDGFFPIFFLRRLSCGVSQLLEGAGWVQLTFGAKTYQHSVEGLDLGLSPLLCCLLVSLVVRQDGTGWLHGKAL